MVENIFTELKAKMAEQKEARLTELEKRLVRYKTALSLSIQLNQQQESELLKHQIMEAGYSEGE